MRFRVEHYRAIEVPESPLGYEYSPTGRVDEVEAHDEAEAAATALVTLGDEPSMPETVSYDPGHRLYAVAGEDEAVRVTELV